EGDALARPEPGAVENRQEGSISGPTRPRIGPTGLEEPPKLSASQGAAPGERGRLHPLEVGRPLVVLGRHQTEPPALLEDAPEGGEVFVGGCGLVAGSEGGDDGLRVLVAEPGPVEGLGVATVAGQEPGDRVQGPPHGSAGPRA